MHIVTTPKRAESFWIDAQAVATIYYLNGECLAQLPEVDIVHPHAAAFEKLRNSEDRTDAHFVWFAPCSLKAAENQIVGNTLLIGALAVPQKRCGCAIGELRGVAGGEGAFSTVWIQMRFQSEQPSSVVSGQSHSSLSAIASSFPITSPDFLSRIARVTGIGAISPSKNPSF
jgi:hypothetical protein